MISYFDAIDGYESYISILLHIIFIVIKIGIHSRRETTIIVYYDLLQNYFRLASEFITKTSKEFKLRHFIAIVFVTFACHRV